MKFIYVDESGSRDEGDVFVMCGLMVDAYKLRKKTEEFDDKLETLFRRHPDIKSDLKTKRFINGKGSWEQIEPQERKDFLTGVCRLAVANGGKIFGVGLSFSNFAIALEEGHLHPFATSYWIAAAMFTSALVQKKMQGVASSKGLTVLIMDNNTQEMSRLSDSLYGADSWYDGLYQCRETKRGKRVWADCKPKDRFNQIINTAFAIKSDHSSLIQVADAICYVYRRHLELCGQEEAYEGERSYYQGLIAILEPQREKLGQTPDRPCTSFYQAACHPDWPI